MDSFQVYAGWISGIVPVGAMVVGAARMTIW